MIKRILFSALFVLVSVYSFAQKCDCETELSHIQKFMEANYVGFKDKQATLSKAGYDNLVNKYLILSREKHAGEHCLLIISQYLDIFKDHHVSIRANFDATKIDTAFTNQKQLIDISPERYQQLLRSKTFEGIYVFNWDSTKYKIAVIKDVTPLHDYVGVLLESRLPGWKKGMIKFEAKMISDSLSKGLLAMQNQMPKVEGFNFGNNTIGGDWHREGTPMKADKPGTYVPVASKKLTDKTLYIKIADFSPSNANNIDSVLKFNANALKTMPYLVLDLRGNSGGADYTYGPLEPYINSGPVRTIGVDVLSTDANIAGWRAELDDKDMSADNKASIQRCIDIMEKNKGKLVNINEDYIDSSIQKLPYPKKIVVLINNGCASTTEQFLLEARQSSKVILMGQHTSGTLDYSNVRTAPLNCMPYTLYYSTTRSRRLDVGQGIDNIGIKPDKVLAGSTDWIQAAVSLLEK